MSTKHKQSAKLIKRLQEGLGFQARDLEIFDLETNRSELSNAEDDLPALYLSDLRLIESKESFAVSALELELDLEVLVKKLTFILNKEFTVPCQIEVGEDTTNGIWFVIEFKNDLMSPKGLLTCKFETRFILQRIVFSLPRLYFLGELPDGLLQFFSKYLQRAMLESLVDAPSLKLDCDEFSLSLSEFLLASCQEYLKFDPLNTDPSNLFPFASHFTIAHFEIKSRGKSIVSRQALPVNFLQIRTLKSKFKDLEKSIASDLSSNQLLATLEKSNDTEKDLPYFSSRFALQDQEILPQLIEDYLMSKPIEDMSETEISLILKKTLQTNSYEEKAVGCLNEMILRLNENVLNAESFDGLNYFIPLALAKNWREIDRDTAIQCLEKATAARGLTPAVLEEYLEHLDKIEDQNKLETLTEQLMGFCRSTSTRASLSADLLLRFSEVIAQKRPDHAAELSFFALGKLNLKASDLIRNARVLLNVGHQSEALEILSEVLQQSELPEWQQNEARDLCQFIADQVKSPHQLPKPADTLATNKNSLLTSGGSDQKISFILEQFDTNSNLSDLQTKLSHEYGSLSWAQIANKLKRLIGNSTLTQFEISQSHQLLARIYREQLHDVDSAAKHLLEALQHGHLESSYFEFLKEYFNQIHDFQSLKKVLLASLNVTPSVANEAILRELLNLPSGTSEEEKDQWAIEISCTYADSKNILIHRVLALLENDERDRIGNILHNVKNLEHPTLLSDCLDALIEKVLQHNPSKDDDFLKFLYDVFSLRLECADADVEHANQAIATLARGKRDDHLQKFVEYMLKQDTIPKLKIERLEAVLASKPQLLAKSYELLSSAKQNAKESVEYLRKAFSVLESSKKHTEQLKVILKKLCHEFPANPLELVQLRKLMTLEVDWEEYGAVLTKQLRFKENGEHRAMLSDELANLFLNFSNDQIRVIEACHSSIAATDHPSSARLLLIHYLIERNCAKEEEHELIDFIKDHRCMVDLERLAFVIDRLVHVYQKEQLVIDYISPYIDHIWKLDQIDEAGKLAQLLITRKLSNRALEQRAFTGALLNQDAEVYEEIFFRMLNGCKSPDEIRSLLSWLPITIMDHGNIIAPHEIITNVLRRFKNSFNDPSTYHLLLNEQGLVHYRSDEYADIAFEFLKIANDAGALNEELLIPFFLLLRDYDTTGDINSFLPKLLQALEKNPSLLKGYPITWESLNELKQRTRSTSSPEVVKLSSVDEPIPMWIKIANQASCEENDFALAIDELKANKNPIEQHLAIQVICLVSGDMRPIQEWRWKVWRFPEQLGYSLSGKERYPKSTSSKYLYRSMHKALIQWSKSLSIDFLNDSKLNIADASELGVDDYLFRSTFLVHLHQKLVKQKISVWNLPGLGLKTVFDPEKRRIYFDRDKTQTEVRSIVTYKIYFYYWAHKLGYANLLNLHPLNDAYPILTKTQSQKNMSSKDLVLLWQEMEEHIYRTMLTETLDLVGICESICEKNLLGSALNLQKKDMKTNLIKGLLKFTGKILVAPKKLS